MRACRFWKFKGWVFFQFQTILELVRLALRFRKDTTSNATYLILLLFEIENFRLRNCFDALLFLDEDFDLVAFVGAPIGKHAPRGFIKMTHLMR